MNGWSWLMPHNFLNPLNKQQLASASPQPLYHLLSGPRPSIRSSQAKFTAWLGLGISKTSTSNSHLRFLYTSFRVAPDRIQVGVVLVLHHPGNPRACSPSGQLQTTLEHHHPAPAQLTLLEVWRMLVIGHNQSLQLTGLGKFLPLTYQ